MNRSVAIILVLGTMFSVSARTFQPAGNWEYRRYNGTYQYHLYIPDGVQAGRKYPMVLGLHGCCWDGDTAATIGDPISQGWNKYSYNTQPEPTYVVAPAENDYSAGTLIPLCRSLFQEFPIDSQRVILTGFSMGAAGVGSLLSSNASFFACAIYVAGSAGYNSGFATVPTFMGVGAGDGGMKTAMIAVVTSARAANGDSRGPLEWVTGVNPVFHIYPNTGHGDAMAGVYKFPEIMDWAYSKINDGNRYPNVRFTQTSPAWGELLDAATTSITVTADARDAGGAITRVVFALDGVEKASLTAAPYTTTITGLTGGDHVVTATAFDNGSSQGKALDKSATATIQFGVRSAVSVATTAMPNGSVGVFYQDTLAVSGGNGPFNWSRTGGTLPPGLTLGRRGHVEGVPTTAGTYSFTATVIDTAGTSASQALQIVIGAIPPGVVAISNLYKKATRGLYVQWLFDEGEPVGATGGYGEPQGLYFLAPSPIYDGWHDVGSLAGATQLRTSSLAEDIASPDTAGRTIEWLSFDISAPARIHIGYPMSTINGVPPWLTAAGFVKTSRIYSTFVQDYYDYEKVFPAGRVVLGPNDGANTGAGRHYAVVVEPEGGIGVRHGTHLPRPHTILTRTSSGIHVASGITPVNVRVIDCSGRVALRRRVQCPQTLDMGGLAHGTYYFRVDATGETLPIVVTR